MLKFISILLTLAAATAQAAPSSERLKAVLESQPSCGNFVRFDERNLYLGFGAYRNGLEEPRRPIPAKVRVAPLDGSAPFELATKDAAIDLVTDGPTAYVLTFSSIEEWDLELRERRAEYPTVLSAGPLAYKEHARAMARFQDKLIIAHGRLGVSIFNIRTKRLVNQFRLVQRQAPLESMATGVTIEGNLAYVVMDNFHVTRPTDDVKIFRGLIVINMESETVQRELGGLDPGADSIVSDGKTVIVSFGGRPIWSYGLETLRDNRLPEPKIRLWKFPLNGHPMGAPALDEKFYYTCFSKAPAFRGDNDGFYRPVPLALDRRVLLLDEPFNN